MIEAGARRLATVAVVLAAVVVVQLSRALLESKIDAIAGDPVNRLAALAAVLSGLGVFALHHYRVVGPNTLLRYGRVFEIVVAFWIAMLETSRPFDASTPVLGLSALGVWMLFVSAAIPTPPAVRLALALAAATTWPLAYAINAARLGFVTESWAQTAVWPAANYLLAGVAYVVGRWTHGAPRDGQAAGDIGSYRLLSPIGEGGMGEVWRASHNMLARHAAIKLVRLDGGRNDLLARRFLREANAIAGLRSPHTVELYDFGTTKEGRLYYVMELLDGIDLQTLLNNFGPQPAPRVIAILRQVCRSLGEAHEKHIVHRDLKPSNVMICKVAQTFDHVKVLDFGLAKPVGGGDPNLTVEGVTLGTPEYMAPEVARGNSQIDGTADLYAVGCTAYVLLTGSLVFEDASPVAVALKHMKTPPVPPSRRTDIPVPGDLERVILKCLEKDPRRRPASARDLDLLLAACDVAPWTEADAADWWARHLPPTSTLRVFDQTAPPTMAVKLKA